jgi:hypothetical protein
MSVYAQCKHFRGVQHAQCDAGVTLATVKGDNPSGRPFRVTWACMPEGQHIPCALRAMPTTEEVAAVQAETVRMLDAVDRGECPNCGAPLVRREHSRGFVAGCPNCPDVSVRGCRGIPA